MKPISLLALVLAFGSTLAIAAAPKADPQALRPLADFEKIRNPAKRSQALFGEVMRVIDHPRCLNCHPATRRPLQGDDMHAHTPPIDATRMSLAVTCRTCHHDQNTDVFAGRIQSIPGDPKWLLAPVEMAWVDKSPAEICRQLKDPARNGNRTLAQMHEHMAHDHLVGWGWRPGRGRTSAPGTQEQFGALFAAWIDTGAECPADRPVQTKK